MRKRIVITLIAVVVIGVRRNEYHVGQIPNFTKCVAMKFHPVSFPPKVRSSERRRNDGRQTPLVERIRLVEFQIFPFVIFHTPAFWSRQLRNRINPSTKRQSCNQPYENP